MRPRSWHFLTGEYPPQPGGVSDYCSQIAHAIAAEGDEVHVWTPPAAASPAPPPGPVQVHRLRSRFGVGSLRDLSRRLDRLPPPRRLLIQYVADAFGYHAMNLPFCLWAASRRSDSVWLMFHEFAYRGGWGEGAVTNLLGIVTPVMGTLLAARADRIFLSTMAWRDRIPALAQRSKTVTWLPIPTNLPIQVSDEATGSTRQRIAGGSTVTVIGHFGTYGQPTTALLRRVLPGLLASEPGRIGLLIGRGSERYASELARSHPGQAHQIRATGGLPPAEAAAHLRSCDILLQPYPDGVTSRRGSMMAGLALGMPIVSNAGELTEPLWAQSDAIALAPEPTAAAILESAEGLIGSPARRAELGRRAAALYEREFSVARSVKTLRSLALEDDGE